jgi:hypothetical protein
MTIAIRWRIVALQTVLIVVMTFVGAIALWAWDFSHDMIHDQLAAQQIYFPPAGSEALSEEEFPDLQQYGGQQVINGDQAKAYADGFIGRHLEGVAGGQTYSQVSAQAQENQDDPQLAAQTEALFRGETLRGLLLNAYGWWTVGDYALYAGIGLLVAALVVAISLIFELSRWWLARSEGNGGEASTSTAAPA